MLEELNKEIDGKMKRSIDALMSEFAKIRTGRAHPELLSGLMVEQYGARMPLNQMASITAESASALTVGVWDKTSVPVIEKAILAANLGLNPAVSGTLIRVPVPPLTEERRRDLVKVVRQYGEKTRVSLRNSRREANQRLKDALKAGGISQDEEKNVGKKIQQLTDHYIATVDKVLASKEKDLMSV